MIALTTTSIAWLIFAVILGGMFSLIGPTIGAVLTISLNEVLRVIFGTTIIGMSNTIYAVLLVLIIVLMPSGIAGMGRKLLGLPFIAALLGSRNIASAAAGTRNQQA